MNKETSGFVVVLLQPPRKTVFGRFVNEWDQNIKMVFKEQISYHHPVRCYAT
jgi:hypothetical protein